MNICFEIYAWIFHGFSHAMFATVSAVLKRKNICSISQFEKQKNNNSRKIVQHLLVGGFTNPLKKIFPNFRGEHKTCFFQTTTQPSNKNSAPKKNIFFPFSQLHGGGSSSTLPKKVFHSWSPVPKSRSFKWPSGVKIILSN